MAQRSLTSRPRSGKDDSLASLTSEQRLATGIVQSLFSNLFTMAKTMAQHQAVEDTSGSKTCRVHLKRGHLKGSNCNFHEPFNVDYLDSNFDPRILTIPYCRKLLAKHGIRAKSSLSKDEICQLWLTELRPRISEFRARIRSMGGAVASDHSDIDFRANYIVNKLSNNDRDGALRSKTVASKGQNATKNSPVSSQSAASGVVSNASSIKDRSIKPTHPIRTCKKSAIKPLIIRERVILVRKRPTRVNASKSYMLHSRVSVNRSCSILTTRNAWRAQDVPQGAPHDSSLQRAGYVQELLFTADDCPIEAFTTVQQAKEIKQRVTSDKSEYHTKIRSMLKKQSTCTLSDGSTSVKPTNTQQQALELKQIETSHASHPAMTQYCTETVLLDMRDADSNPWLDEV